MAGQTKEIPLVFQFMAYEVLARKWRPRNFSELAGQDTVQKTLTNALKNNRLYPVLLFTGPRGTGKTSSARILAKILRCQNQKNFISCDQCEDCLLIQDSRHLDVIEIDGASNNGVDAVRELRDTINYLPSTGLWKIYIIDEVHMLSNSAFNALLKTLEEPPGHVLFIMATTESHKIPQTVLSRCQNLDFHLLSPRLIKTQLEKICKKENIHIKEEALWLIAKQARGSLRDGQSLLDQMITFCGDEELTSEKIIEILGLSDPQILFKCLKALIHRQEIEMIELIESLRKKGNDPKLFLQSLIEGLRNLLLLKKNPENQPPLVQASQQEIEQMKEEIKNTSSEDLHFLFDMFLKGEREMSLCYDNQLVLEVLLLRFCGSPQLENLTPLNPFHLENKKKEVTKTSQNSQKTLLKQESQKKTSKVSTLNSDLETSSSKAESLKAKPLKEEAFEMRFDFLNFLRKKDQTLSALVEMLSLKRKAQNHFCFTVPEKFSYLQNKIKKPSYQKVLENYLIEFLGLKDSIKLEFLYSKIEGLNLREEKKIKEQEKLVHQAKTNSFVKEVKDIFQAKIKSVEKKD